MKTLLIMIISLITVCMMSIASASPGAACCFQKPGVRDICDLDQYMCQDSSLTKIWRCQGPGNGPSCKCTRTKCPNEMR